MGGEEGEVGEGFGREGGEERLHSFVKRGGGRNEGMGKRRRA